MADPTQAQTMILRFRDLSVDLGGTVKEHSAIIDKAGCAWWGWWKKQGEKVPVATFQGFAAGLHGTPLEIYLFDTGTLSLFKTTH